MQNIGKRKSHNLTRLITLFLPVLFILSGCGSPNPATSAPTGTNPVSATQPAIPTAFQPAPTQTVGFVIPTTSPSPVPTQSTTIHFAIIGDFGSGDDHEKAVADLVKSWKPDFIITVGDNNYPNGAAETIDQNIGQFYHEYINDYHGQYGEGSPDIRFYPTLGNHDWLTPNAQPYLDYFSLPGNERYYDFSRGPVAFFALDSDSSEPDGVGQSSVQAAWLQKEMTASAATWKIVYMHQPAYSSGMHGSTDWIRWPFAQWGASAVLAGHDHSYERLDIEGTPYFVNGIGGGAIYNFVSILDQSKVRYNQGYGAMLAAADPSQLDFQFITVSGQVVDTFSIKK